MSFNDELRGNAVYGVIFKDYPDVVNIEDLMTMLNIGRNSSYTLINTGAIPSVRVGKIHKIPKINVIDYLLGDANKS